MIPLETEVKFYTEDRDSLRNLILGLGAESRGRFFEQNIRFEDGETSLFRKKSLLRLRQDSEVRLTFKSEPPEDEKSKEFKVFEELEVAVSDFATMKQILESLGFHSEQTYEKWRETFVLGNAHLCLDTMPFGDFLEIEGTQSDIRRIADQLGLRWEERILENYLGIFDLLRRKLRLPFSDVTFENFKTVQADLSGYLRSTEAG